MLLKKLFEEHQESRDSLGETKMVTVAEGKWTAECIDYSVEFANIWKLLYSVLNFSIFQGSFQTCFNPRTTYKTFVWLESLHGKVWIGIFLVDCKKNFTLSSKQ